MQKPGGWTWVRASRESGGGGLRRKPASARRCETPIRGTAANEGLLDADPPFLCRLDQVVCLVERLSEALPNAGIGHPPGLEEIRDVIRMLDRPGKMNQKAADLQLVDDGAEPAHVVLIRVRRQHEVDGVGCVSRLDEVHQALPRIHRAAVDDRDRLVGPRAVQISPAPPAPVGAQPVFEHRYCAIDRLPQNPIPGCASRQHDGIARF